MTDLSWQEAIRTVLSQAASELHYSEISSEIAEQGLRATLGATPDKTVAATLSIMRKAGEQIEVPRRGYYVLPDVAQRLALVADEQESEAEVEGEGRLTVGAYGLYWGRALVDWNPARGQSQSLWGRQNERSMPVNFADQDGIYMLHNGNEVAYVGQSYTPNTDQAGLYGRLKSHHDSSRKADRWETFSWFGFRSVDDSGNLAATPGSATTKEIIDLIEGIFIEGMMPRLNMRRGEGTKAWEANLYNQVEDPQLIANRLSALVTVGQAIR